MRIQLPWSTRDEARQFKLDLNDLEADEWLALANRYFAGHGHRAAQMASAQITRLRNKQAREWELRRVQEAGYGRGEAEASDAPQDLVDLNWEREAQRVRPDDEERRLRMTDRRMEFERAHDEADESERGYNDFDECEHAYEEARAAEERMEQFMRIMGDGDDWEDFEAWCDDCQDPGLDDTPYDPDETEDVEGVILPEFDLDFGGDPPPPRPVYGPPRWFDPNEDYGC